ncbi:hypothetical protein SAMN04487848_0164 [Microbacterium sp. ru370.1]|uniref:hypothetical protein n=1 Tax=unclassified Microbacterium TaxID=2609290 RepID=UPI00088F9FF8|nr:MULTISPECIES: hypothetical protein [unclassified Microbacterium]SDO27828.1 hypothetical protein SAMN04487848_0164 [Microbacterium sp. ru370.1]SIT74936.1 hypothetical protein SAMN05880579_0160 [Microbacterium sp. RU1D]
MSTPNNRRRDPGGFGGETLMLLVLVVVVVGGLVVTNVAVRLGAQLDGTAAEPPSDPFGLTLGVILARVAWPASAIWIVAVLGAILLVLTVLVIVGVVRHRKGRTRVDRASSYMGRGKDVAGLSRQNAVESAERLGAKDVDGKSVLRARGHLRRTKLCLGHGSPAMLGGMEMPLTTRRPMPDWIALILLSCAGFAVATSLLLVGAGIDRVFFNG